MTAPEDPVRWIVDDDGWLTYDHNKVQVASWAQDPHHDAHGTLRPDAFAALVADVRAARVHEGCTQTTDTLRQARKLAAQIVHRPSPPWRFDVETLLDLLLAEGTDR